MAWQPAPESLQTLAVFLKDSLSGFDKNAQKKAELVSLINSSFSPAPQQLY
jgi:transportin-1